MNTETTSATEAEAVAKLVGENPDVPRLVTLKRGDENEAQVMVLGAGLEVHDLKPFLDEYREAPERRKGTATLADLASFIAHTNRFKSPESILFCDRLAAQPRLVSVLDYHEKGHAGAPAWGQHRGSYAFPFSDEWKKWIASNGKKMGQAQFAQFIEDRITDVSDPLTANTGQAYKELLELLGTSFATPSKLVELSRGLSVRENAKVKNAVNLATGEANVHFETTLASDDGAPLKVPGAFLIAIPVFHGGIAYRIAARLRFRAGNGAIEWWYDLHDPQRRLDAAIDEACAVAAQETALPLLMGTPE